MPQREIFISYRRSDSAGHARALHRDLCRRFDVDRIYFDRRSVDAGTEYSPAIEAAVQGSAVVLVLIAPGWLDAAAPGGGRRLDLEDDLVRREVALALASHRNVIPVLFDDTPVPAADKLPAPLKRLARLDGLLLRGKDYEYEVQLAKLVEQIAAVRGVTPPAAAEGLMVAIGAGEFDVYRAVQYAPIRLRAPLRKVFDPLIDDRTRVFAGRREALARVMEFAAGAAGGCLVITAPPGFGKTALVANLVAATPEAFAYHFFAPVYGEQTLDERFFLQNVVQQMAAWHGHAGELPDRLDELRALYHALLATPPVGGAKRHLLVLDGIDEVSTWSLAPYLSRRLPPQVRIVATIRDVGQDWRAEFGFPPEQLQTLPLDGLDADAIGTLLESLGGAAARVAADKALLAAVVERAAYEDDPRLGADPFYVRFLAEDLAAGEIAAEQVGAEPKGLQAWLDRWWQQLRQRAGDAPVRDLFGTLAAALGPIGRAELEAVNPSLKDDWAGDYFDQVLQRVRRLVRRDRAGRYRLAHPRLRDYVADSRRIGAIDQYRQRLLAHCEAWAAHRSAYALAYRVSHRVQAANGGASRWDSVFSADWIAAQWVGLGSYSVLVGDLDRAAAERARATPPDLAEVASLTVARSTAAQIMAGLPEALLVAWVASGDAERALECLRAQGRNNPDSIDSLAGVAAALAARGGQWTEDAEALAMQAVDLVPALRLASAQVDAIDRLGRITNARSGLPGRRRLLRELDRLCESIDDPVAQGCALAALAGALGGTDDDAEAVAALVDRTLARIAPWPVVADRAHALALLLPALQAQSRDRAATAVAQLLAAGDAVLDHGSLKKLPLVALLRAWEPPASAVPLLEGVARRVREPEVHDYAGWITGTVAGRLLWLGQVEPALAVLETLLAADQEHGLRAALHAAEPLWALAPDRMSGWLQQAQRWVDPALHDGSLNRELFVGMLAAAQAAGGRWNEALESAASIDASERTDALLSIIRQLGAGTAAAAAAADLAAISDRLQELAVGVGRFGGAADQAAVLTALAALHDEGDRGPGPARAVTREGSGGPVEPVPLSRGGAALLARAGTACLASMPEGDLASLHELDALALHVAGRSADAVAAARAIPDPAAAVAALARLVEATASDAAACAPCADALRDRLLAAEAGDLGPMVLIAVIKLMGPLVDSGIVAAGAIGDRLSDLVDSLPPDPRLTLNAMLAAVIAGIDGGAGANQFEHLVAAVEGLLAHGAELSNETIVGVAERLAEVALRLGSAGPAIEQRLRSLPAAAADPGLAADLQAALIVFDCGRGCAAAAAALAALLERVDALAAQPPRARYLTRSLADVQQRSSGENEAQAQAVAKLAEAIDAIATACPVEAADAADRLLAAAAGIGDERDRAQALVDIATLAAGGSATWQARLDPIWNLAEHRLADEAAHDRVVAAVVEALCSSGAFDHAHELVSGLAAAQAASERPETASDLRSMIELVQQKHALGELDVFEQAACETGNRALAFHVLQASRAGGDLEGLLQLLVSLLEPDVGVVESRAARLGQFLPAIAPALVAAGGAQAVGALAARIEALDDAFVGAAGIVAAGGAATAAATATARG